MRSVSADFNQRWLATPVIVKQAFHQELSDIIAMLQSDTPSAEFNFTHQNFGETVAQLLKTHKGETPKNQTTTDSPAPSQSLPATQASDTVTPAPMALSSNEIAILEERIFERLAKKLDDTLSNYMADISEDLRSWLQDSIKKELAHYTKSD